MSLQFCIVFAEGVLYTFVMETLLSFGKAIFENASVQTSDGFDSLAEHEKDFCLKRLLFELVFLDVLKELLLSRIGKVCSREDYLALRKKKSRGTSSRICQIQRFRSCRGRSIQTQYPELPKPGHPLPDSARYIQSDNSAVHPNPQQ